MTIITEAAKTFWYEHYNAETSWWPLWFSATLWSGLWLYAKFASKSNNNNNNGESGGGGGGIDFSRWYAVHALHHAGAILLGSLSLHIDDDSVFNERICILWSLPYFFIDIVDSVLMGHALYTAHGVVCFGLGLANYNLPLLRSLRMNSKASYIETSSIILYQAKQRRETWLFATFAVTYTACRIIWIPCMANDLLKNGMEPNDPIIIALGLFYLLQIHWWIKIIRLLVKGKAGDRGDNRGDAESKKKD